MQKPSISQVKHYVPALDGLRGLAVLSVLFYHADLRWMPGGFLGVDVFFALSGYLITALLLHEWDRQGKIDLKVFWQRRIYRLFPAMLVLIVSVLVFAAIWLPDQAASLRSDALAALGYMGNWHLILTQRPYFEAMGRPPLLRHLWSLAVEAQFYLLWPLVFILTIRKHSSRRVLIAALVGAAMSLAWMAILYHPYEDPSRVYYGADTRLSGPLIGAALACVWKPDRFQERTHRVHSWLVDGVGLCALGALAAACVYVDEFQAFLYRGGFAMAAILTAVAMAACTHPHARFLPRLLSSAPLRWLGMRAYGLYLWHWPVFMVTRPRLDLPLDGVLLLLLRLGITAVLVECSYRLIERPARYSAAGWANLLRRGLSWGAPVAMLIAACVVLIPPITAFSFPAASAHLPLPEQPPTALPTAAVPQETPAEHNPISEHRTPAVTPALIPSPEAAKAQGTVSLPQATPTLPISTTAALPTPTLKAVAVTQPVVATPTAPASLPVKATPPTPTATPLPQILALGDSVMAGARHELEQIMENIEVDAAIARQAPEMLRLLRERRQSGRLGDIVVIHLGSNGILKAEQFDEMMAVLSDVPKVVFVNVRVPRRWQDPINKMLLERTARYPNVALADWYAASTDCPKCFIDDGIHLTATGAQFYAGFIATSVAMPVKGSIYNPLR